MDNLAEQVLVASLERFANRLDAEELDASSLLATGEDLG